MFLSYIVEWTMVSFDMFKNISRLMNETYVLGEQLIIKRRLLLEYVR